MCGLEKGKNLPEKTSWSVVLHSLDLYLPHTNAAVDEELTKYPFSINEPPIIGQKKKLPL